MPNLDAAASSAAAWITGAVLVSILTIMVVWGAIMARIDGRGPGPIIQTILYGGIALSAVGIVGAMQGWFGR